MTKAHPTIAFVLHQLEGYYHSRIWHSFVDSVKEKEIGSVWFVGRDIDSKIEHEKQHNMSFQLLMQSKPDGILAVTGALNQFVKENQLQDFLGKLPPTGFVSLSYPVPKKNCVLVDNRAGVEEAVDHLFMTHGCRRIGFLRGPRGHFEAEERFQGYLAALGRNGIPYYPELVLEGDFVFETGLAAGKAFLKRGVPLFDSIICSNDPMARGMIKALNEAGITVPGGVKVVGFDDSEEAYASNLPLTTIRQPYRQMVEAANEMLLSGLSKKEKNPNSVLFPTELVARRTCGCFDPWMKTSITEEKAGAEPLFTASFVEDLEAAFRQYLRSPEPRAKESFLKSWESFNILLLEKEKTVSRALKLMARFLEIGKEPSNLLIEASVISVEAVQRFQLSVAREQNDRNKSFQQSLQSTLTTLEMPELLNTLAQQLPNLGISTFYLSFYTEPVFFDGLWNSPALPDSELLLAVENGVSTFYDPPLVFPSGDLVPKTVFEVWGEHKRNFIVLPLFFQKEHFGFMLVEVLLLSDTLYGILQTLVSSAIKSVRTHRKIEEISVLDELTGLYNRRGFMNLSVHHLELARRRSRHFLVVYLDLDGLKEINDRFGHKEGDWAIKSTAAILRTVFRTTDIIGRMGGDEFTVFAFDVGMDNLSLIRNRIDAGLEEANLVSRKPYKLSVSLGVAPYNEENKGTIEEILDEADQHLYQEKLKKKQPHA